MRWPSVFLVTFFALLPSCGYRDLPNRLFVDSRCSPFEREAIQRAVQAWNDIGTKHVGEPLIVFEGYRVDKDGVDIDTDLSDNQSVMYCVNDPATYEELTVISGSDTSGGISFGSDMAIFPYKIADKETGIISPIRLARVATHELGHWLGLPHSKDPDSIMVPAVPVKVNGYRPSQSDVDNICIIYGCD